MTEKIEKIIAYQVRSGKTIAQVCNEIGFDARVFFYIRESGKCSSTNEEKINRFLKKI